MNSTKEKAQSRLYRHGGATGRTEQALGKDNRPDGRTDERTEKWLDGRTARGATERTEELPGGQRPDGLTGRRATGRTEEWPDGRRSDRTDGEATGRPVQTGRAIRTTQ